MLDKQSGWIWVDGKWAEWQDATFHLLTHSLHYGGAAFEGERAYNGKIFKMSEHHQRLHDSAAMLDFKIPYTVAQLDQAAEDVLRKNGLTNAYVRPIAWRGAETLSVASHQASVHVAIAAWQWDSYFQANDQGLRLMWSDWTRPAPTMAPVHAKASGLYLAGTLSKNKAEASGFHDALMLDYRGYVAECTGANLFMVKEGKLFTPIADCFLDGFTRRTVIELAQKHQIVCTETYIKPEDLSEAEEVFVTGSAAEVSPVCQIGEKRFPIGNLTQHLGNLYRQLVRGEK